MSVGPYNPLMVEEGDTAAMLCEVRTKGQVRSQGSIFCKKGIRKTGKSCDNKQQEMDVGNEVLRAVKVYKESLKKESECQC